MSTSSLLAAFQNEKYLSLESIRKNGAAVATPVWFAEQDGVIYVYTEAASAKVKRIRNNRQVRIAPCTYNGKLRGDWVAATAKIVDGAEEELAHRLLDRKYWLKHLGNWYQKIRKGYQRAVIAIHVE
jgi:PPOX class probable F420-dependent enzyme